MFRAMFSPIIRSTWLYLQLLVVFTQVAAGTSRQRLEWILPDAVNTVKCSWWWAKTTAFQLIHDTSRQRLEWIIPNVVNTVKCSRWWATTAVNTVKCSWWLAKTTPETCRTAFQLIHDTSRQRLEEILPDAVNTVKCSDDGRKQRPKHVELTRNNKLTYKVASCWLFS